MNTISTVTLALAKGTGGAFAGSYVDLKGYDTEHGVIAVLDAKPGTTPGTCGGSIVFASDTAGTGLTTAGTFSTITAAGGQTLKAVASIKRYVKFVGTTQAGKDMLMHAHLMLQARELP